MAERLPISPTESRYLYSLGCLSLIRLCHSSLTLSGVHISLKSAPSAVVPMGAWKCRPLLKGGSRYMRSIELLLIPRSTGKLSWQNIVLGLMFMPRVLCVVMRLGLCI